MPILSLSLFILSGCSDKVVINHYILYDFYTGGTVTGIRLQSVLTGKDGTAVTAVPNKNYHFLSWSDGLTSATRHEVNVQQDYVLYASFEVDK